jgi:S1-C subfamily serine protease
MAVVAWVAGLFGAWMGVRLADGDRAPARQASTLGLVEVEPRDEPLPPLDVFAAASTIGPSVVSVSALTSSGDLAGRASGSGVILTSDGEIVTNAHVIEGAATVSVRVPGETEPRGAAVLAVDVGADLALLRIDADELIPAAFAHPDDIRVGDDVVAVGYALGLEGDPSVTVGIVSALGRTNADDDAALKGLIQTDAPISSGNSGGALVNSLGQVVGITTLVAVSDQSTAANNLGFAISNAELLPALAELRAAADGELPADGYLGVAFDNRIDGGSGALITEVVEGSPADDAGLRVGDSVVAIDDAVVAGRAGLVAIIRSRSPGDEVAIHVRRGGEELTLRATLVERPVE